MAFPDTVASLTDLLSAANDSLTTLDGAIDNAVVTVTVVSTATFPNEGVFSVDAEIIKYTGKTATSFTGCARAFDNTVAASHLDDATVSGNVVAAHHNLLRDEIRTIETALNTQASPTFAGLVVNGNVGINTDANDAMLLIGATGTGKAGIALDASNGDFVGGDYGQLWQANDLSVHLDSGNHNLILNENGGNVGIGTSEPSKPLHVVTTGTDGAGLFSTTAAGPADVLVVSGPDASNPNIAVKNDSGVIKAKLGDTGATNDGGLYLYNGAGNTLNALLRGEGDSYLKGGKLGVGTDAPTLNKLQVSNSSNDGIALSNTGQAVDNRSFRIATYTNKLQIAPISDAGAAQADAFYILRDGKIGIGTSNPIARLHIHGGADSATYLHFTNTPTGATAGDGVDFGIQSDKSVWIWNRENSDITIGCNNATCLTVLAGGGISIGTTGLATAGMIRLANNADLMWRNAADSDNFGIGLNTSNQLESGALIKAPALLLTSATGLIVGATNTPASAGAAGAAGTICYDASYVYVCVGTNTWKRAAISTW